MSVAARTVKPDLRLVKANEQRLRAYTAHTLKKLSEKAAAQLTGLPLGQVKALRSGLVTPSFETGHYLSRMDPTFPQRFADLMAGRWIPAVEDASPHAVATMIDTAKIRED